MRIFQRLFVTLAVLGLSFIPLQPALAVSTDSLYLYDFANAGSSIQNQGLLYPNLAMNFLGNWSSDANGVNFTGNTTNLQSGGNAKPASGTTLSVATNQAIGAAVIFNQTTGCGVDSQNISQIGVFATGTTQVKLQLSKCASGKMYPECRIAGSLTPANTQAVRGTLQLAAGKTYKLECVKGPDAGTTAPLVMRTTDLSTGQTTVNNFSIPDTGAMSSTAYLTAGNKYPLPSQTKNTDQYNGNISKLGYCRSASLANVQACLDADVVTAAPNPDPDPEPTGPVDEIKFAYGNTRDKIVFSWRGQEDTIYYGSTPDLGSQVVAAPSLITPVDIDGPFMEAQIAGLTPGASYYYKIGEQGVVKTFNTAASDETSFKAVSIGDTIVESCRNYQAEMNDLVGAINPSFVLHGGDISIANECGEPAVHEYYQNIMDSFSTTSAFMPTWGNHEYGNPTEDAPVGTPRDTLANYKGRSALANPQTVPSDTATKTGHPGCGEESSSSVNTCQGEDWGWFRAGRVVFISFPEPWPNAIADWRIKAGAIMEQAQNDPTVDFVVTYGHRPVLSSTTWDAPEGFDQVFSELGDLYSSTARSDGKYILNITQHRHNMEVFTSHHGVMHVVNGGGGQGLINFASVLPGSDFRMKHLGFSTVAYDAVARTFTFEMICGPSTPAETSTCTPGSVIYSKAFESNQVTQTPDPAQLTTTVTDNSASRAPGETYTYTISVANQGDESATNVVTSVLVPANLSIVNAGEGQVNGQEVSWPAATVEGSHTEVNAITVALSSSAIDGETVTIEAQSTADGSACSAYGSCISSDTNNVLVPPSFIELVTNRSVESDMSGWTGKYGSSSLVSITRTTEAAYDGSASIKVLGLAGASNLNSGFNDSPYIVPTTILGKQYVGSVWVKPSVSGQQIVLRLREWSGSTLVTDNKVTLTTSGTDWQQITNQITPAQSGNRLAFIVYGNDIDAGEYFYADNFSLVTAP